MQFTNLNALDYINWEIFNNNYFNRNKPFFLKRGAQSWPAFTKWSNNYLSKTLKNKEITIESSTSKVFNFHKDLGDVPNQRVVKMPEAIKIICEDVSKNHYHYILQQSINNELPELLDDMPLFNWMDRTKNYQRYFWFGQANNQASLHFDLLNNIFVQVRGRKLIRLCSPEQSNLLYQVKGKMNHLSKVLDLDNCDLRKFPKVTTAEILEFILEPGDVMFIPTGWWHQVSSLDTSISISCWYPPTLKQCLLPNVIPVFYSVCRAYRFLEIENYLDISEFSNDLRKIAKKLFELHKGWLAILFCDAYIKKSNLNNYLTDNWIKQVKLATKKSDQIDELYCLEILNVLERELQSND